MAEPANVDSDNTNPDPVVTPTSEAMPSTPPELCGVAVDSLALDITSESASYCMTFTARWTPQAFQLVPESAHFTTLVGAAVNDDSTLWASGELASRGLEEVAELGSTGIFASEIEEEISINAASALFRVGGTGPTGTATHTLDNSRSYPLVTFATMVAPSSDWFVGLSGYSLLNPSGEWVADTGDIDLPVYDAGTESGNTYSLDGVATLPPERIERLSETVNDRVVFEDGRVNGNFIASVRFQRVR